jgi:molybdenum cofactor cytidylyltransferase
MISTLWQAFRLNDTTRLSLVGAGGKSITLFRLGREHPGPVLLGCTAHLSIEQAGLVNRHLSVQRAADIPPAAEMGTSKVTLFTGPDNGKGRWSGLPPEALSALFHLADELNAPLIFESDGSRCLPLKAWDVHEPPIPQAVDTVVVCVGLSGLGKALDEAHVFRAEKFSQLSGLPLNAPITLSALATVLSHPEGGIKNIPDTARRICLLNQADDESLQRQAKMIATQILGAYSAVVVTSLGLADGSVKPALPLSFPEPFSGIHAIYEKAGGIILAAGGARRMGQPKLLLPWRGEPIIRHTARHALEAGLSPLVVVTGSNGERVEQALDGLPVQFIHNPDWQMGQSTSVKCGLAALPADCGSVAFLLGDQPQIPAHLVRALVEKHSRSLAPLTCPLVGEQRGNPVLFDRSTFADFATLTGDAGARQIINRYPVDYLPWHDQSLLWDVDTPEDYARLQDAG